VAHASRAEHGEVHRVLIIEDQQDSRDVLKLLLELYGYVVDAEPDGLSGIEAARAHPPALAIIDIGLPNLDGWAVAHQLRDEFDDHIRLIALTSRNQPEDRVRSQAAGFDLHMVKPTAIDDLEQAMTRLLHDPDRPALSS
jgi:CheY-like chemotaxis protein